MNTHAAVTCFGPFRLSPAARVLEKDGVPLAIGSRALDILIVLVEHAGEVVGHRELMAKVWRGLQVEACNLRVNIVALRKLLGEAGAWIRNVPGQGYVFVGPLVRSDMQPALHRMLSDRQVLLILDNRGHLLEVVAPQGEAIRTHTV